MKKRAFGDGEKALKFENSHFGLFLVVAQSSSLYVLIVSDPTSLL